MTLIQATCERLPLAENSVDMIWTDPPYNKVGLHTYAWLASEASRVLKLGGFVAAMAGGLFLPKIYAMFEASGLTYYYEMVHKSVGAAPTVWKGHDLPGGPYPIVAKCKPIIVYSKGPSLPRVGGILNMFENGRANKVYHHWGQDVESARYYIDFLSALGDLVVDPFLGGGTTWVACRLIGRRFIGMDIDPAALATTAARMRETDIYSSLPLFQVSP